jgi:hypothetical protein
MAASYYQTLLSAAKTRQLQSHELDQVVSELADPSSNTDRYTLLHIVGLSQHLEYEQLVSSYLESASDPMLARIALQVLCDFWNLKEKYRDRIIEFIRGVSWDYEDDVRQIAMASAGEYLRDHNDQELLASLIATAKDENTRNVIRDDAIRALARALQYDWGDIPPATDAVLSESWASTVVREADGFGDQ